METLSYTVILEPADEGGYTVSVPALPAVVTEGDTFEEALAMARDAIRLYLDALAEDGRPIPTEETPGERMAVQIQIAAPAAP